MAENILYLLRADKQYTELEARALDAALILHADTAAATTPPLQTTSSPRPGRTPIPPSRPRSAR